MDFLKKLFSTNAPVPKARFLPLAVRCRRCGEVIEGRVDVENELSAEYEGDSATYYCRKVLMGDGQNYCYQQVEVELLFDGQKKLTEKRIVSGGSFVEVNG